MLYIQYDNVSAIAQKVRESNHYHTQLRLNLTRVRNRCVRSRDVHPCCMVSRCPVSRCPPLLSGAVLSGLVMSVLAISASPYRLRSIAHHALAQPHEQKRLNDCNFRPKQISVTCIIRTRNTEIVKKLSVLLQFWLAKWAVVTSC